MNEPATLRRKPVLRGWRWSCFPVVLTAMYHSLGTFDFNYTANVGRCFSIPYFVIAAIIGVRRGSRLTVPDFLFLVFGDFLIVTLLWHVNPYIHR